MASELDDLRSFMEQRFSAAFPNIDTTPGSAADIQVITPLINRLAPDPFDTPLEDFLRARVRSEFPDLVLQKGEPIDDLVIKINRILLEPFRRQIVATTRNQSLQDPTILNDREADALAANYFAHRRLGGFSTGVARLFFNAPRFIIVQPTNAVFTPRGLRFLPVLSQAITADDMLFNQSGSLFYFDVTVRAEQQGVDYNIDRNTLVGIEGIPSVVKVQNRTRFEEGAPRETTIEFLTRVQQELTEKSLVTFRGIRARLLSLFEAVRSIAVIGYNSPEMLRDVITGSPGDTYAFGSLTASPALSTIEVVPGNVTNGTPSGIDFVGIGLAIGDVFRRADLAGNTITDYTVTEVVSNVRARVTPTPPSVVTPSPFMILGPSRGSIRLSDIPGGILQPQTIRGEILVQNNQVHIGGVYDVFIRAGAPQDRSIQITSVRDGDPLHFGVDLESFGANGNDFRQITPRIAASATTNAAFVGPGNVTATVYIKVLNTLDGTVPWRPTVKDVGRYLELLGVGGIGTDFGMYIITAIGAETSFGGQRAIPVTISTSDQNTGTNTIGISNRGSVYDLDFRIVEALSAKSLVRDRSSPQVDFNGNASGLGAVPGDSVIVESGTDAGIYTIRQILTSIGEDDTLVLDRDLTTTVTPSGSGDGSGLRYRLADSLQVDLVSPRVTKMPLGSIFPADDLQTVANSPNVTSSGTSNFLLAGVAVGDTLEIIAGDNKGEYTVLSPIAGTSLALSPAPPSTGFNQSFLVYKAFGGIQRPLIRVTSTELLDSANQPTGITVPYGDVVDIRVLGTLSNRSDGDNVESFQGSIVSMVAPLLTLEDLNIDFVAQGVVAGNKLEIFEGQSIGEYEIASVAPGGNAHRLLVHGQQDGGRDFVAVETELHYQIGDPSTGIVRLFFVEPTSVEIDTGLSGGRLQFKEGGQNIQYRFSEVQGHLILPAPGSGDSDPRDLRVARSFSIGGGNFNSILEITDNANPDVFEAELRAGDLFEVRQQIQFKDNTGSELKTGGIFGTPAGLHTVTGSNRVKIPANSHIDFTQMGDLAGQTLSINSGPDTGIYAIERVVGPKELQLNAVMTGTTLTVKGLESATLYDASIVNVGGNPWLLDPTDSGQLPNVGEYVTIFEAASTNPEGTFQIAERDLGNQRVRLTGFSGAFPVTSGTFTWIATDSSTASGIVQQAFSVYQTIATEVEVTQVATKAPDVKALNTGSVLAGLVTFQSTPGSFTGVVRGDRLEILVGPNKGVYPIVSATSTVATVYSAHPFAAIDTNVPFRVWAGIHGSRRMVTVGPYQGTTGLVANGDNLIYRVRRPGIFRISSTEMQNNIDESGLFYIDMEVESLGPGDNRNLAIDTRLTALSGLRVDGYTYTTENKTLTFSMYEEVTLNFGRRFLPIGNSDLPQNRTEVSGRNIQIRYETSTTVQLVNDLLRSDTDRVVNANPIARHFLPSFVFTKLTYSGGSSVQVSGPEVEDYINSLGPLDPLAVSDLEAILIRRGATKIRHPIILVSVTHDITRKLVVERSDNLIGGDIVPYEGSARISSFFATIGAGITLVRV